MMTGTASLVLVGSLLENEDGMLRTFNVSGVKSLAYPAPTGSPTPGATGANFSARFRMDLAAETKELDLRSWYILRKTWTLTAIHALSFISSHPGIVLIRPAASNGWTAWLRAGSVMELHNAGFAGFGDIAEPAMAVDTTHKLLEIVSPSAGSVEMAIIGTGTSVYS